MPLAHALPYLRRCAAPALPLLLPNDPPSEGGCGPAGAYPQPHPTRAWFTHPTWYSYPWSPALDHSPPTPGYAPGEGAPGEGATLHPTPQTQATPGGICSYPPGGFHQRVCPAVGYTRSLPTPVSSPTHLRHSPCVLVAPFTWLPACPHPTIHKMCTVALYHTLFGFSREGMRHSALCDRVRHMRYRVRQLVNALVQRGIVVSCLALPMCLCHRYHGTLPERGGG
jgi:hypothetical protein